MKELSFDIVCIGGGAGGLFAASVAKALGAKTCIIDKTRLGGDCTWFGCMPSKAVLKSSQVAHLIQKSADYGLKLNGASINTDGVMKHVRSIVAEIATHHEPQDLRKRGIEVLLAQGHFIDGQTFELPDQRIKAKKFIICTGSHPVVFPIPGLKEVGYLTNETVFSLDKLPKSLIVLGGGPIGIELSQALGRLGVKINLIEMMDRILIREEKEISAFVENQLKADGLSLFTGRKAVRFRKEGNAKIVTVEDKNGKKEDIASEEVLVAIGRAPNLEGLNLEKAGVEYTPKGIKLNEYLQTTNTNIFASGDVASPYQFSHVAAYQASIAVRNALFKRLAWAKVNYNNVTWATFTDPELAHLGLTEEEARKQYSDIKVYTTPYTNADRAVTDVEKQGLLKVITDRKGLILGAHVVGANAGEIIQGFLIAKSNKIRLAKLAQTLYIYPTLSELVKKTAAKPFVEQGKNPLIKFLIKLMKNI
jgi:pyruvate/2-oxoglutarate dehydrogenase complex dihydrolipoamide dehydrogenase (E3) component